MAGNKEHMISFVDEANKFNDVLNGQIDLLAKMTKLIPTAYAMPSDLIKNYKELLAVQEKLNKANLDAEKAKQELEKTRQQEIITQQKKIAQEEKELKLSEAKRKAAQSKEDAAKQSLEKVKQQEIITQQKKLDQERKALQLSEAQRRATLAQEAAEKRRLAQNEKLAKKTLDQNSAYLKLQATWSTAQRTLSDLLATENASTEAVKKAKAEFYALDKQIKTIDSTVKNYSKNVGNYKSALNGTDILGGLTSVAGSLGIGVGVAGVLQIIKDSFAVIREFDNQMINVQKTTGLTNDELIDMKDNVIALSDQLKIVSSATLGEYMAVAGQLGVKGKANLLAFTDAMAQLEIASNITGEQGAADIARLLTLVDGGVHNVKAFGNEIVILGNNFAATESEILGNATRIAQSTGVYKLGRQQVLAYATATKAIGVEAELVGSTMGRTLGIFEKAIRTTKGLDTITNALGVSQDELAKRFKSDASGVLLDYIGALNKVDKEGGSVNAQLEAIGITAVRDQAVISSLATNGFKPLQQAMLKVTDAGNAMGDEFENASKKINNEIAKINVSWKNLILNIDSGDGIITKAFRGVIAIVDNKINELRRFNSSTEELIEAARSQGQSRGTSIASQMFGQFETPEKIENEIKRVTDMISAAQDKVALTAQKANEQSGLFGLGVGKMQLNKAAEAAERELGFLTGYLEQIKGLQEAANAPTVTGDGTGKDKPKELTDEEKKALQKAAEERAKLDFQVRKQELANQIESDRRSLEQTAYTDEQKLEARLMYSLAKDQLIQAEYDEEVRLAEGNAKKIELAQLKLANSLLKSQEEREKMTIDFVDKVASLEEKAREEKAAKDQKEKDEEEARQKKHYEELERQLKSYLAKYTDLGQFGFGSLNRLFDENFMGMLKNSNGLERMALVATTTGDILKDVFSNLADLQNANYEAQISRLDSEKNFAIQMAGDNSAAKEEIERQYEEKRKAIARRQAEDEKKQAIFATTISIAQGIAAALPNLVLAGLVASLGAIQLGAIIATPIPEYWTGTDNAKEGLAWTQEKGAEVITDKRGRVKTMGHNKGATLTYLNAGDKVYKSQEDYFKTQDTSELDSILTNSGINPIVNVNAGVTKSEMLEVMSETVSKITLETTNFDASGYSRYKTKMRKLQNNRNRYI